MAWQPGCQDHVCVFDRSTIGEMYLDPETAWATGHLEIEVTIKVFTHEGEGAEPREGVIVELISSRNQGGNVIDIIEQPRAPTDTDGRATAYLGSSTPGELVLRATANGALLCETWNEGECIPLERVIAFYIDCGGAEYIDCDGECVDPNTDPEHCGACNNACELENASSECVDSTCVISECDTDWESCDDDDSNGCESNLLYDPNNCGSCGITCTPPELCDSGSCLINGCDPGATELCDGYDNDCDGETDEDPSACDDGNQCTDDLCERGMGCVNILMAGIACNDNDDCTENDVCNDQGVCEGDPIDEDCDGHSPPPCGDDCDDTDSDINPGIQEGGPVGPDKCTDGKDNDCDGLTDRQDPGCCGCIADEYCDDGDPCNGNEWCEVTTCICMPGTPIDCDDYNDCTSDICVFPSGACQNTPLSDGTVCDDGDECTTNDICSDGACWPGDPMDSDDDGYPAEQCGGTDCDDGDPAVNPGVTEGPQGGPMCSDGVDNDCDTNTDGSDSGCVP
jgi:hypothetical protein